MFATRLRKLRENKEMTQREVADLLGMTPKAVGFYEQGKREPSQEALLKLSEIFDVSVDYLLCKTDLKNYTHAYLKEYMLESKELTEALERLGVNVDDLTIDEVRDFILKGAKMNEIYKNG